MKYTTAYFVNSHYNVYDLLNFYKYSPLIISVYVTLLGQGGISFALQYTTRVI